MYESFETGLICNSVTGPCCHTLVHTIVQKEKIEEGELPLREQESPFSLRDEGPVNATPDIYNTLDADESGSENCLRLPEEGLYKDNITESEQKYIIKRYRTLCRWEGILAVMAVTGVERFSKTKNETFWGCMNWLLNFHSAVCDKYVCAFCTNTSSHDKHITPSYGRLMDGRMYLVDHILLYSDGFSQCKFEKGSAGDIYCMSLKFPVEIRRSRDRVRVLTLSEPVTGSTSKRCIEIHPRCLGEELNSCGKCN